MKALILYFAIFPLWISCKTTEKNVLGESKIVLNDRRPSLNKADSDSLLKILGSLTEAQELQRNISPKLRSSAKRMGSLQGRIVCDSEVEGPPSCSLSLSDISALKTKIPPHPMEALLSQRLMPSSPSGAKPGLWISVLTCDFSTAASPTQNFDSHYCRLDNFRRPGQIYVHGATAVYLSELLAGERPFSDPVSILRGALKCPQNGPAPCSMEREKPSSETGGFSRPPSSELSARYSRDVRKLLEKTLREKNHLTMQAPAEQAVPYKASLTCQVDSRKLWISGEQNYLCLIEISNEP